MKMLWSDRKQLMGLQGVGSFEAQQVSVTCRGEG